MSAEKQKISCSVCHAYLFDEDDVVYCPVCGAPHHRDCYNKIGHCALEEFHGTEQQYDKLREKELEEAQKNIDISDNEQYKKSKFHDTVTCPKCENSYPSIIGRCPRCGTVNPQNNPSFTNTPPFIMFDLLGGVPKDMDIGDGVTADEAKQFVVNNTHRYIPKFAAMKLGSKASWNWLAFLLPSAWYMSRKMYLKGILITVLLVSFSLLSIPLLNSVSVDSSNTSNIYETQNFLTNTILSAETPQLILAVLGLLLELGLRIFTGILGDWHYRNHTISTIKEIKSNSDDIKNTFRKKGGISFIGLLLGFFAIQYLPTLISYFFNLV